MNPHKDTKHIPDREKNIRRLKRYYQAVDMTLSIHGLSILSPCEEVDKKLQEIGMEACCG